MPTSAAKSKKPEFDAPTLAAIHLTTLALGKENYKKADIALEELLDQVKVGEVITLPNKEKLPTGHLIPEELRGKKFCVADKFAKKNSIGVGLSARRYEVEEVEEVSRT